MVGIFFSFFPFSFFDYSLLNLASLLIPHYRFPSPVIHVALFIFLFFTTALYTMLSRDNFCPLFALRCLCASQGLSIYLLCGLKFYSWKATDCPPSVFLWKGCDHPPQKPSVVEKNGASIASEKENQGHQFSFFLSFFCGSVGVGGKGGCSILAAGLRKPSSPFQGPECFP